MKLMSAVLETTRGRMCRHTTNRGILKVLGFLDLIQRRSEKHSAPLPLILDEARRFAAACNQDDITLQRDQARKVALLGENYHGNLLEDCRVLGNRYAPWGTTGPARDDLKERLMDPFVLQLVSLRIHAVARSFVGKQALQHLSPARAIHCRSLPM